MLVQVKPPAKATVNRPKLSSGFGTLGEFLQAVGRQEISQDFRNDPRFEATVASGLGEAAPSIGGFLVQSDQSHMLLERLYQTGEIALRVQRIPLEKPGANGLKLSRTSESPLSAHDSRRT